MAKDELDTIKEAINIAQNAIISISFVEGAETLPFWHDIYHDFKMIEAKLNKVLKK